MTLPTEAELLGASLGKIEIKGPSAQTVVNLSADGQRKLSSLISGPASSAIYLALENVRGTFDAAVLSVFINLPENARPGDHPNLLTESVALYGLNRASAPQGADPAPGLTFILEITRVLMHLAASNSLNPDHLRISIIPDRPLPDSTTIVIDRISLFITSAK